MCFSSPPLPVYHTHSHYVQTRLRIFDLTGLLDIDVNPDTNSEYDKYSGINFTPDVTSYNGNDAESDNTIDIAHNIVTNSDTNMIYLVGGSRFVARRNRYVSVCSGGLYMIDVSDPLQPKYVGCYGGDKYVHDAECVIYKGPDTEYVGHEICFCFNQNTVTIVDVTDKKKPRQLSRTDYKKNAYTHQGWLSSNQKYLIFSDEEDEIEKRIKTRTMVYDITNLTDPTNFQEYFGSTKATDHNLYVVNAQDQGYKKGVDLIYQANYQAGFRVLKVIDYSTANFTEIGYFDFYPKNDDPTTLLGAFSVFPFFNKSGRQTIVVSSIREGLFILKPNNTFTDILTPDTSSPTNNPTVLPSSVPSTIPSTIPTSFPSYAPTESPTNNPTVLPSSIPSSVPSSVPSTIPTSFPSYVPTDLPSTATISPSVSPTDLPTDPPSTSPTDSPTASPTALPTDLPSDSPSDSPTTSPTTLPTDSPSDSSSDSPTTSPTTLPIDSTSNSPSNSPIDSPTTSPTSAPRGDCENLITYLYENRDNKDCNRWVAKKPKKRCKKKDSSQKNKKVRKFCPSVCKDKCKEKVAQS
jgi:choice-of-anchor B domain-containing protein